MTRVLNRVPKLLVDRPQTIFNVPKRTFVLLFFLNQTNNFITHLDLCLCRLIFHVYLFFLFVVFILFSTDLSINFLN